MIGLFCFLFGCVMGGWSVWMLIGDHMAERGKHVVPESIEYRSYWVHNGRRYYAGELDDPYVPPRRLDEVNDG